MTIKASRNRIVPTVIRSKRRIAVYCTLAALDISRADLWLWHPGEQYGSFKPVKAFLTAKPWRDTARLRVRLSPLGGAGHPEKRTGNLPAALAEARLQDNRRALLLAIDLLAPFVTFLRLQRKGRDRAHL